MTKGTYRNANKSFKSPCEKTCICINRYEPQMANDTFIFLGHGLLTECKNNGLVILTIICTTPRLHLHLFHLDDINLYDRISNYHPLQGGT